MGDEDETRPHVRRTTCGSAQRICAWTVTSSAVVGSSAITSEGDPAIAMRSSPAGGDHRKARVGRRGPARPDREFRPSAAVPQPSRSPPMPPPPAGRRASSGSARSWGPGRSLHVNLRTWRRVSALAVTMSTPHTIAWRTPREPAVGNRPSSDECHDALPRARLAHQADDLARGQFRGHPRRRAPCSPRG